MDLQKIKYFVAAAQLENIHAGAAKISISAPAVSKAISALEDELGVLLFERSGRNIVLTSEGKHFLKRANELLDLSQSIKTELMGHEASLTVTIAGREFLLNQFGLPFMDHFLSQYPKTLFEMRETSGASAIKYLEDGVSDFSFTVQKPEGDFAVKQISEFTLVVAAGKGHPLFARAKKGIAVPITEVLSYDFVSPNIQLYGRTGSSVSIDGWRDDKFPRKIRWKVESAALVTSLVAKGKALAYVPDFWLTDNNLAQIKTIGCDYICRMQVYISAKKPERDSWKFHTMKKPLPV
jgi:DNA-binding transcriptional LysR family regulator